MLEYQHLSKGVERTKKYIQDRNTGASKSLLTSKPTLNSVFMDGIDWNRILTIGGLSGCLGESTRVVINRGKRSSGRQYTIKDLFEKYHGEWSKPGKWFSGLKTNIRVYKEDHNVISYNEILDVVYSGKKELFLVTTESGKQIEATADHKFLVVTKLKNEKYYLPLKDLKSGDFVAVRQKRERVKKKHHYRKSITGQFQYYPNSRKKLVEGKTYYECLEQRAVYDAFLNNYTDVRLFLQDCCKPNSLIFSDSKMEIHHIDGDTRNNNFSNLQLLSKADHAKEHFHNTNMLYEVMLDKIVNITSIGVQDTYDICCKSPYNNFVANDFVVHNSGKSTILEELKRDFCNLNERDFYILSFEFEMLIEDQLTRSVASKVEKSVKELYSQGAEIDDALEALDVYSQMPIYFVDNVGTVQDIRETIVDFVMNVCKPESKNIIITLDHLLLTKGKRGDDEKDIIDELMRTFVELKKYISSLGIKCLFVSLSQLNRDIESPTRVLSNQLHYPNKTDLFAASSTYYCSDYVIIAHRPASIPGITRWYGPPKGKWNQGLPLKSERGKDLIFFHVIKERFGSNTILFMEEDFKYSRLLEYDIEI